MQKILVTGSAGLVGTALCEALSRLGADVVPFDTAHKAMRGEGDICDRRAVHQAARGCCGIVHLAAVARVADAESDPALCEAVNVGGTRNVLAAALAQPVRPWVIFASSREVYGQAEYLPVTEASPLNPINTYGRSKAAGERLVAEAQQAGLRAAIVRLANVYGSINDYPTRVIPAFAQAAVRCYALRVHGPDSSFDFTHVDDVVRGILRLIDRLAAGPPPPPIHLVSGTPTTLGELATLVVRLAGTAAPIAESPSMANTVSHFFGCPARAQAELGWQASITLEEGLGRIISAFKSASTAGAPT